MMADEKWLTMNAQDAIAKAEQELSTSSYIAEITRSRGMKVIHSERCRWLAVVVCLAKKAVNVDAVEVVHGRWEDEYGGKYANPRYRCSVCKEKALYKFERDLLGNYKEVQALTPNCPNCGAKMDGDGNV